MSDDPFPLYHWSPTNRRKQITRYGLRVSMWSTDRVWKPPMVCFAANPELAWVLSAGTPRGKAVESWDLWVMWSDVPAGFEEITDTYPDTGRSYIKEYRVYERVMKRDLWFVGTRTQRGERAAPCLGGD